LRESPQGNKTFDITPFGKSGNYFVDLSRQSGREQWIGSAYLPSVRWFGSHQLRFGADAERDSFDLDARRHDYRVLREDLSVARYVRFLGDGFTSKTGFQAAEYIQDRWSPADGVLIEAGLRFDLDTIVHYLLAPPRAPAGGGPKAGPEA